MQKNLKDLLVSRAQSLLENKTVDRVFGFVSGELPYDLTPHVFESKEELSDFEYNMFAGANFSKYLINETRKQGRILVFLKPCDTYSFNQLLTEHRFDREKVYAVGIECDGMLDIKKIKEKADSVVGVCEEAGRIAVSTLYDGTVLLDRDELLLEKCRSCKSKKHVAYDELIGADGDVVDSNRFDEVSKIERMSPDERFAFWQGELSRCIRCNACRDVCPACTCEKCVFDNPTSGVQNKAAANSFEEKMFHIIRAFHVAGRCTDCGECSRVCPQSIPLHLLNRKFIKDINEFYGEYQAGEDVGSRAPLVDYTLNDIEPSEAVEGGKGNV